MPPCYLILFDDSPEEIDLSGGTMMVLNSAENLAVLTATLDTGVIKAYGGVGEVLSDPNTVPLMTVLKGLHPH